jgi:uncharacterized protein
MHGISFWSMTVILMNLVGAAAVLAQSPRPQTISEGTVMAQAQGQQRTTGVQRGSTSQQLMTERVNQNTVTVVSGNPNGSYLYLAYDMSAVLDDGENLRVLPVIGKGGYQNVKDILHLKGVDLGITQSNIMTYLKSTGELGTNIQDRLSFISKLYNEEMHLLVGAGVETIQDLSGKKCNFSDVGSGTQFSTRLIFGLLGVKCEEINVGQADAFLKIKSGEIAATILIAGKPSGAFRRFKLEPGMRMLPVPYAQALESDYFPATLTHKDYPNLIPEGQSIETVAVGAVLAVYNWPRDTDRFRRVAKFIEAFFGKFDEFLKEPRHPKWQEANLAAPLKGWSRFPAAQDWLDRPQPQPPAAPPRPSAAVATPAKAVQPTEARAPTPATAVGPSQEQLYREFLEWRKQQGK